jgi:hypothetical protein
VEYSNVSQGIVSNFHSISVVHLGGMNATRRSMVIHEQLLEVSQAAQSQREKRRLRFNFDHLEAFLNKLLLHFHSDKDSPFSPIHASRAEGFDAAEFSTHLLAFMRLMPSEAWL